MLNLQTNNFKELILKYTQLKAKITMKKVNLLNILASTAMLGMPTSLPESRRRIYPLQGNQGWGQYHSPKVRKWRLKEKAAKKARKINWN